MAIQIQGAGGSIVEAGAFAAEGLHITTKPLDYGALGHYRFSRTIVIQAAAGANGHRLAWRWTHVSNLGVLLYLRLSVVQTAAATATIWPRFDAFIARGFTTFHTTSVTALTLTGNSFKKRTSMGTTLVGNIGASSAAAGMTGQAATLDADAFLELQTQQTITTTNQQIYVKELDLALGCQHPYVFAQNEGIIVRGPSTVFGAAGTADLTVEMAWAEVTAF